MSTANSGSSSAAKMLSTNPPIMKMPSSKIAALQAQLGGATANYGKKPPPSLLRRKNSLGGDRLSNFPDNSELIIDDRNTLHSSNPSFSCLATIRQHELHAIQLKLDDYKQVEGTIGVVKEPSEINSNVKSPL